VQSHIRVRQSHAVHLCVSLPWNKRQETAHGIGVGERGVKALAFTMPSALAMAAVISPGGGLLISGIPMSPGFAAAPTSLIVAWLSVCMARRHHFRCILGSATNNTLKVRPQG
jgi:hypothetical protein